MAKIPSDPQLELAQLYALDLDAQNDAQLQLLHNLCADLQKAADGPGGADAARAQFSAAVRRADRLVRNSRAQRELLNDLRSALIELRRKIRRDQSPRYGVSADHV